MPTCCVPGCTSRYRNDTSASVRHFFSAPSDEQLRAAWNRAIPRADKTSQRSLGYAPSTFTIRTFANRTYMWSTEKLEIPRGKCSLVEGALPKVFPNFPCQSQRRRCGNRSEKAMETLTKEQHHCSHKLLAAQFLPMPWSTICPSRPRRRLLKWNA